MLGAFLWRDPSKNVFPPKIFIFMGSSWIHDDFSVSCAPAEADRWWRRREGWLHVCYRNRVVFFLCERMHQKPPESVRRTDLIQMISLSLSAELITFIFTFSQSDPLIQVRTERWTSFHKPSEREQELVRLNMQQAACRRHTATKIFQRNF